MSIILSRNLSTVYTPNLTTTWWIVVVALDKLLSLITESRLSMWVKWVFRAHLRSKFILHLNVWPYLLAWSRPTIILSIGSGLNARSKVFLVALTLMMSLVHNLAREHRGGLAEASLLLLFIIIIAFLVMMRLLHINIINVLLADLLNVFRITIRHLGFLPFSTIYVSPGELELTSLLVFLGDISLLWGRVSFTKYIGSILTSSRLFERNLCNLFLTIILAIVVHLWAAHSRVVLLVLSRWR